MQAAFSVALVGPDETEFDASHMREDLVVFDLSITHDEGDFAALTLEVENPRVGLLAPGRPLWVWVAWNSNFQPDEVNSSGELETPDAVFADMVPLFFGRIVGIPDDLTGETVRLTFLARPLDFDTQKRTLANSLRVLPYFDGIWFSPDTRFEPDNVLESRAALFHIDRVTHAVTISNIVAGEDGTITVDEGDAFYDSVSVSYGEPPCRQVNVVATVSWDQKGKGTVPIVGSGGVMGGQLVYETYTGQGLVDSWPQPGATIGGDWAVGRSEVSRVDGNGKDVWSWSSSKFQFFGSANLGDSVVVPTSAQAGSPDGITFFPAHILSIKKWKIRGNLAVDFDTTRGKSETVAFVLRSDTQSILTDSTDGEAVDLTFSSSEVSSPIGVFSDGEIDVPIGKASARSYLTTSRGSESLEYLLMVARAKLISAARCVDVTFEVPWAFAIAHGISLRKSAILTDNRLPGGLAGGKIKSYTLTATGGGTFGCTATIGCTIGRGGTIEADEGTPTYVADGYVNKPYQRYEDEFIMPVAGEVAYRSINGLPPNDDGFDLERMTADKVLLPPGLTVTNLAATQKPLITTADQPADVYKAINSAPTTFSFALRPLNSGPFATNYFVDTTLLAVPKTIDLEATGDSS